MDTGNLVFTIVLFSLSLVIAYSKGLDRGKSGAIVTADPNRDKAAPITEDEAKVFIANSNKFVKGFWESGKSSDAAVDAVASLSTALVAQAFVMAAKHAMTIGGQHEFADFMGTFEQSFEHHTNNYLSKSGLPIRIAFTGQGAPKEVQDLLNQLLGEAKNETPKGPLN